MNYDKYKKDFSDKSFLEKVKNVFAKAGVSVIYAAMLLFYVLKENSTPIHIKGSIVAALGYFICPIDLIPDMIPFLGFSDDLSAIIVALKLAADHVTEEIRVKAKENIRELFKNVKEKDFEIIDSHLNK